MKSLFLLFITLVCFTTFAQKKDPFLLSVDDFDKKLKEKSEVYQLIDVRTPAEFANGHIRKASNINFTDDDFEEVAKKRLDKTRPVFVYCFSGKRSTDAAIFLRGLGFKEVYDLSGGFAKWTSSSKPYISNNPNTKPIAALTIENLDEIVRSNDLVLINFYTDWCESCKKMTPILNKIADENKQIKLLKIDGEKNDILSSIFKVEENPTYIIIKKGRRTWSATGEMSESEIKEVIQKLTKL